MRVFTIAPEVNASVSRNTRSPFFRVILNLSPDCRQFVSTSDFAAANPAMMDFLSQNKIKIRLEAFGELGPNDLVAVGPEQFIHPGELFLQLKKQGVQFLCNWGDRTEEDGYAPKAGEFVFYSSETQLLCALSDGTFHEVDGAAETGINPQGGQGALLGLMRKDALSAAKFLTELSGEAPSNQAAPKAETVRAAIRLRLEEELGLKFAPNLPLVAHFMDHRLDSTAMARGLNAVSRHANVLIKEISWHGFDLGNYADILDGPNIHLCPQHSDILRNMIRFSADFLLPTCFSGLLATSLMIGLRVLPVYTRHMSLQNAIFSAEAATSCSYMLRAVKARTIPLKIMDHISPISFGAVDMIIERLYDEDYWRRYDEILPQIQRSVFGSYHLDEDAVKRAATFILRILQTGSLIPEGAALRPLTIHPQDVPPVVVA